MKILIACKEFPHSRVIGGPIIIYNRLKHLSQNHLVSLVSFSKEGDERYISSVESFCHELRLLPLPPKRSAWKVTRDFLFSPVPHYFLRVHGSQEMSVTIAEMVKKDGFDVVIAEYSVMGQFIHKNSALPPVKRVISVHESYYLARLKDFHHHGWGLKKFREVINLKGLKQYEFDMYQNADKVLTLTPQGKQELLAIHSDLDIAIVPHGVDTDEFLFSPLEYEEKSVVFLGNYLHYPNVDAVLFFRKEIWPGLKSQVPGIKFYIVGQGPPPEVKAFSEDESIIITGKVDDVKPYLKKGQVFICPVRLGGGFRGKILEAMAIGRPIVSTPLGAEGIPSVHGENILLAENPQSFIRSITDLLTDSALFQKIQRNGRKLVEDKYAWAKGVEVLEEVLEELVI